MKHHKIHLSSSWQLPPTIRQSSAIARLELALGITDIGRPANRAEGGNNVLNSKV